LCRGIGICVIGAKQIDCKRVHRERSSCGREIVATRQIALWAVVITPCIVEATTGGVLP